MEPRLRILRLTSSVETKDSRSAPQLRKLQRLLESEHRSLTRCLLRLKGIVNALDKQRQNIRHLQRHILRQIGV